VNEKIEAVNYLIDNNIGADKLIPGTGLCSIKDTVMYSKVNAKLKVKAILVLPAFYYKNVSNEGVVEFYKRVIGEVGDSDLKYILYNIPQVSGVSIGLEVIEQLIKLFPNNVVGMKESSGNLDNMLRITKYFNNFSLFSGSDSLALKVCQRGGAGAITACSNISGKLLNYIINNYKKESEIKNFQLLQQLQEQIRKTLLLHEPISALKAFLSVTNNNENWNKVNPPLIKILHPKDHKTVMSLIELIKKMDELLPSA
ncbi:uncharacterized protein METZ01_LOCUS278752, partial [marine metagenome]